MSVFDRMSVAVGIGRAQLTVRLDEPEKPVGGGDRLRGVVETRGGKVEQTGVLLVRVQEHWTTTTYNAATKTAQVNHHYRHYGDTHLTGGLTLKPEEAGEAFRFALTMPPDGALHHDWSVNAVFDVPGASDARADARFPVAPPPAVAGLLAALQAAAPLAVRSLWNDGPRYEADLRPATEDGRKGFDGVRFSATLDRDRDALGGTLHVNPQEHTLGDHLQALFRRNNRSEPLHFTASTLAGASPDEDAVALLRALLYAPESDQAA